MKLNFDKFGDNAKNPPLIILHGLYGSASNFRGLAKQYAKHFTVYCLDLRNHGASPHSYDVSYPLMAADVIEFMDDHKIKTSNIVGHSMGGKTAMQIALSYPERISKLLISDIAPVKYGHHHERIFEGLNAINLSQIKTRGDAELILKDYVDDPGIRLFLLSNLVRLDDGGFKWRINMPALNDNYDEIADAPKGVSYAGKTLFVRGELSDYIHDRHVPETLQIFTNAKIETIEGGGHWLHSQKPKEFTELLMNFFLAD